MSLVIHGWGEVREGLSLSGSRCEVPVLTRHWEEWLSARFRYPTKSAKSTKGNSSQFPLLILPRPSPWFVFYFHVLLSPLSLVIIPFVILHLGTSVLPYCYRYPMYLGTITRLASHSLAKPFCMCLQVFNALSSTLMYHDK